MKRSHLVLPILLFSLVAGTLVMFALVGDRFEEAFHIEGARRWMENSGTWAWLAGIGLLVADIALPIPGTLVMSALGWIYGWMWGGLVASVGSILAGGIAFGICRWLGRPAAQWIAGEDDLGAMERWMQERGGWIVALSRWLPILPEAVACLAGLAGMKAKTFFIALACGSIPLGFVFAAIGHIGKDSPNWAIAMSAILPAMLWLVAQKLIRMK